MPLTEVQRTLIISSVGDVDSNGRPVTSNGVIETLLPLIESQHSGRPNRLIYLYSWRDSIDLVLGKLKNRVNTRVGNLQVSSSQASRTLLQMRDNLEKRIVKAEQSYRISRASTTNIALIEAEAPVATEDRHQFVRDIR